MGENPPQREIWSRGDGSHPEEKSGQGVTDPTPKKIMGAPRLIVVLFVPLYTGVVTSVEFNKKC